MVLLRLLVLLCDSGALHSRLPGDFLLLVSRVESGGTGHRLRNGISERFKAAVRVGGAAEAEHRAAGVLALLLAIAADLHEAGGDQDAHARLQRLHLVLRGSNTGG
eukprot:CAMPEP_0185613202 /NCGR_PEP_ID=MMETSP0436-20130131/25707_1 /TAXON_ID=626734 ORGANISM="Favella taraikaensis, Strain Fe Narragansett Bay" /NCGR_SAMPLE_ID=MMETSP0436 /ASSEMBLY_ACC=CAM_ASM_000390 /LENGTH=105 /DNA_ID=CAMNT_0028247097 /DNA_START=356 /DNA_END=670 /DNA_ORIENTATION=-